jgi:hypothetical protein
MALMVTVSIGVAEHQPGHSIEATLADADRALYQAKNGGRNCTQCWVSAAAGKPYARHQGRTLAGMRGQTVADSRSRATE